MKYLSANDIRACFSMKEAIAADKEALAAYSAGKANIPLRTNIDIPEYNGQSLYMPGYATGDTPASGIKIVSVYPENAQHGLASVPATMVTLDAKTGIVNAILDGTYLTQLRTGAVQGAATDLLARKDSKSALLIGAGGQALSQLTAMLTVRPLTTVYIFDLNLDKAHAFIDNAQQVFDGRFAVKLVAVADPNDVVADVDIITSVTTAKQPTFDGSLVQTGTHINGVGAYTPEMKEIPGEAISKADHIWVDTKDGTLAEAGDLIAALKDGQATEDNIDELGQLVNQDIPGRTNDRDITFFKTVGSAVLDIVVANKIVQAADEQGIGTTLD